MDAAHRLREERLARQGQLTKELIKSSIESLRFSIECKDRTDKGMDFLHKHPRKKASRS